MNDKIKHILIDVTVIFVFPAVLFYLFMTLRGGSVALLSTETPGIDQQAEGARFELKLRELHALKLDTSIFESAVYKSLVDTTIEPPTDEKGRPIPFIPPVTIVPTPSPAPATPTKKAVQNLNNLLKAQ